MVTRHNLFLNILQHNPIQSHVLTCTLSSAGSISKPTYESVNTQIDIRSTITQQT